MKNGDTIRPTDLRLKLQLGMEMDHFELAEMLKLQGVEHLEKIAERPPDKKSRPDPCQN
jgi:hypothetical protein